MRRQLTPRTPPTLGDTKLVRKFAWVPTVVGRSNQFQVWLEYYAQYYVYDERVVPTKFGIGIRVKRWFPDGRDLY